MLFYNFLYQTHLFTEWKIYLSSNPGLDYDTTSSYSLTIECEDDLLNSDTMTLDVTVNENSAPVFTGLPDSADVGEGDDPGKIYDMVITDSDPYICSLTPAGGPFNVQIDTGTSGILAYSHHI